MTVTIPALNVAVKAVYLECEDGRIAEFQFKGWVTTPEEPVAAPTTAIVLPTLPEPEVTPKTKRKYNRKPKAAAAAYECESSFASDDDCPAPEVTPPATQKEWDKNTMLVPLDKCLGTCDYAGKKGTKRYAIYRLEYKDGNIKGYNLFFITKKGDKGMGVPNYKNYGPTHGFFAKPSKVSNITWHDAIR